MTAKLSRFIAALSIVTIALTCAVQAQVQPGGGATPVPPITTNHCVKWASPYSIADAGAACGTSSATGANPTATIGASAVNGSASTFMRSDAAPALPATLPALNGSNLTNLTGSNISSGTVPSANGGAGTITGALKGNGAGVVSQAACGDLSNASAGCSLPITTGLWLPVLTFAGGTSGLSASCVGNYTQYGAAAGDFVFASFNCTVTTIGTSSGNASITGLPASSNAGNFFSGGVVWQLAGMLTAAGGMQFQVSRNGNAVLLMTEGATGSSNMTASNFPNGATFQATVFYAQ